jgi:putative ABC transport system permease protein
MWMLTFVLANLRGRPARSLLTLSGVAVAVAAVVSLLGIVRGFEKSLLELYEQRGIDLLVHQSGRVQMTSSVLPASLGEEIASVEGVAEAYPSLIDVLSLLENDMMGVPVQGWPDASLPLQQLEIVAGRNFTPADRRPLLLGQRLAAAAGKQPGDQLELLDGESFEVVGIFETYNVFDSGSIVTRLSDLQSLLFREEEVTLFAVVAADNSPEAIEALAGRLAAVQQGIDASPVRDLAEKSSEIKVARSFAWVTSTIALIIGSIGMLNTLMMSVFERTREIAMLRALGWKRRRIVGLILGEATLLCSAGAVVGIGFAILAVRALSRMPAAGRLVAGDISLVVMGQGFALAILLGLLGGLYPAWSAARLPPVEGLRHD